MKFNGSADIKTLLLVVFGVICAGLIMNAGAKSIDLLDSARNGFDA